MKNKHVLMHIISAVLSFTLGIASVNAVFYYNYKYKDNIGMTDFSQITEFDNENIWQNIYTYYTEEMENNIDSYHQIYSSNSLNKYLDTRLKPYYEKYGYEVVLTSAINDKHTFAKIYAMEKCISILKNTKLNRTYLSEILDKIKIDSNSSDEKETKFLEFAKKRLSLAKALAKEDFSSDQFVKSSSNKVFVWIDEPFGGYGKLNTYSDGDYYSYDDCLIDIDAKIEFITKDMLKVFSENSNAYIITFKNETIIYDIKEMIRLEWELFRSTNINVKSMDYDGHTIKGSFYVADEKIFNPEISLSEYILYPETGIFEIHEN